ncbi:type II CAAX prenyl endopeptidase Rce1 family protein [Flavobacterium sp. CLA17]|uniref:CPBP family intramembrane glutamic endopeptidase n=1 Tax=Leptolyngbya sp. Cla-17 TaxID=2803751 RepID=UPI0014923991
MSTSFLNAVHQGKNHWKYYLLSFLCIITSAWLGVFISTLFNNLIIKFSFFLDKGIANCQLTNSWVGICFLPWLTNYTVNTIPFFFLFIGVYIATQWIHQRRFFTLINSTASIQWNRLILGFCVWFLLLGIQLLIELSWAPQHFEWSFHPLQWLVFLLLALILTPLQTSTEELLFRGYFLQSVGQLIKPPVVLAIATSLPFAMAHFGNSEMNRGSLWTGLTYGVLSLFLAAVTLKDNRLELALGIHAANNLFILLIVNSADSSLRSPSLLTQIAFLDPQVSFLTTLIGAIAVYAFLFKDDRNLC